MAQPGVYLTAQCRDNQCRLRFPATAAELAGLRCPRCGGPLASKPRSSAGEPSTPQAKLPPAPATCLRLSAVLDNIRSIHNIGSIFRTADGAGFGHLYLCGYTATPEQPRLAKAALGAEQSMAWSSHPDVIELVAELKDSGCYIIALERSPEWHAQSPVFGDLRVAEAQPVVLVVGNEKAGVDPDVLSHCDRVLALPMAGVKNSLNVAVAFGIAAYQLRFARPGALDATEER